jgi:uncharacterized membrane protein YgdD (TMEM256/DUF423 family)
MFAAAMNLVRLAGSLGFVGVALGAFGAHGLKSRVGPESLDVWKTAVLYHLFHVLALLALAALGPKVARANLVAGLFTAGIALFSGSLYVLVLGELRVLGAVTPLGGVAFLAGWLLLVLGARRA